jgi:hypothetical protein
MFGKRKKLDADKESGFLNEPKCAKCKQPIFPSWKDGVTIGKLGVTMENSDFIEPKEATHGWYHMDDPLHETSTHTATPHDGRSLADQHNSDMAVSTAMLKDRADTAAAEKAKTDAAFNEIMGHSGLSGRQFGDH